MGRYVGMVRMREREIAELIKFEKKSKSQLI